MKALLVAFLPLALAAGSVGAQAGAIGVFGDPRGASCELYDRTPGLTSFYIVHVLTPGAMGSQYSAPKPACLMATWLSDTNMFPVTIGNSQVGMSVAYGSCRVGPIHVQTMNYFGTGTTPACCRYGACPHVNSLAGLIEVIDCDENLVYGWAYEGIVNSTPFCGCYACASPACVEALHRTSSNCYAVSVEDATWGRVKSAYSE